MLGFNIGVRPAAMKLICCGVNRIATSTDGRCRAHIHEDGYNNAIHGMGAECATIMVFNKHARAHWFAHATSGSGICGVDIKKEWVGLSKNIEVKSTQCQHGHLFVRTISNFKVQSPTDKYYRGDLQPPYDYWERNLPDSYYLFVIDKQYDYKLVGFATKDDLLKNYGESALVRTKINRPWNGYPLIGMHYTQLRPLSKMV